MKAALTKPRIIIAEVEASRTAAATGLLIVKVPLGNVPSTFSILPNEITISVRKLMPSQWRQSPTALLIVELPRPGLVLEWVLSYR